LGFLLIHSLQWAVSARLDSFALPASLVDQLDAELSQLKKVV
jgi:hypothetical protein